MEYGVTQMVDGQRSGQATGLTYAAADGETVTAPQAGNVVFAGTLTLTGGTVVIDHGCGVKSYLYGLETVGVERGQSVSAGDPLGTAGTAHNLIYELRIGSKSTDRRPRWTETVVCNPARLNKIAAHGTPGLPCRCRFAGHP